MNEIKKAKVIAYVEKHLARYMEGRIWAYVDLHPANSPHAGIKNLHAVPHDWWADVHVPGFIVRRTSNGLVIE